MADEQAVQESVPAETPWQAREIVEAELRPKLRKEYEDLFRIWKAEELVALEKQNNDTINEGLTKLFEKWQADQKPPDHTDIQKLLDQEYEEFNLSLSVDGTQRTFTIKELPQTAEIRFLKLFCNKLADKIQSLAAVSQEAIDKPFEDRVKAFLDLINNAPALLAEAVVIVLNPRGEDKEITVKWVQDNIGSDRQWRIAEAQVQVNRLKDFFSRVSQSGQATQMMLTGQRFQQLQQLAL